GYIILYPTTGAGAYMIAGGENGGDIVTKIADILGIVGFAAGVIGTAFSVPFLTVLSIAISVILLVKLFIDYLAVEHKCQGLGYLNAITVFTSVASIFSKPLMSVVLLYTGLVAGNSVQAVAQSQTCKV
ncbi:MAG TPA: hypothetical protein VL020_01795, partial [Pseudomonadales bacterium]|nr:hypothetical protein [Pseudomonadales bacterium]